jgi:hypothetical protein
VAFRRRNGASLAGWWQSVGAAAEECSDGPVITADIAIDHAA